MTANNNIFNHQTTADEVLADINLTGKRVLITGGSSGLGAESARAMAAKGAEVIITARKKEKAAEVVANIKKATGSDIAVEELELGSFASIRAFADRFLKQYNKLNILINNAGVMACPQSKTEDGIEMQFGANYLGHFLMTNLIMPSLINGAPSRVVCLSSAAHSYSRVLFDDINFERTAYQKFVAYGQAKSAVVLFAVALDKRLSGKGVRVFSVHPGVIDTPLGRHFSEKDKAVMSKAVEAIHDEWKTVESGAATQVYAATHPDLNGKGGLYLSDCNIAPVDDVALLNVVRSYAVDPDEAERLWSVSEEMVGQKFSYS